MSYRDTYQQWVDEPTLDPELKADLKNMADDETTKEEAFAAPMAFGTAGMRGVLGAGIGRMNIYTVRQATEGLAGLWTHCRMKLRPGGLRLVTTPVT